MRRRPSAHRPPLQLLPVEVFYPRPIQSLLPLAGCPRKRKVLVAQPFEEVVAERGREIRPLDLQHSLPER